jgi:hypothetical protein
LNFSTLPWPSGYPAVPSTRRIADATRLGDHATAAGLTEVQLDAMTDFVVNKTGENRAQLAQQHSVYIATRFSLARRSDGHATTTRQPNAAAQRERKARQDMIESSRNASRPTKAHRSRTTREPPRAGAALSR